ncbi:MAG: PorV/PorQ family protein [Candidatus Latescibacteria bacterium]|nr:PorV/PorQ family protein [Candidatus Latescibacterota bacterium]
MLRFLVGFLLIGGALLRPATAINENAGTTGFNFLKIGVGARAAALGGAYTAVEAAIEASAWNPAGLLGVPERSASISYNSYLVDTQAGFLNLVLPGPKRTWGINLNYFTYGDMRRTDINGQDLGSFAASDMALGLTLAQPLWNERLKLGVNFKAAYSTIDDFTSDAYMVDIGLLTAGPLRGMTIGASITNLGSVRTGYTDNFKDSLPVNLSLGVAHSPAHTPLPMTILLDFNAPNDNDPYISTGVEIHLANGLFIRPGYSTRQTGLQGDAPLGITAGAGLSMQEYRLDYAFTSYADLGDVHRFSLSGAF